MHQSHKSWQDPLRFNPSRWHQYQHPKSSSSNATAATASTQATTASKPPNRPSTSAATAAASSPQLSSRAASNNGASSSNREVTTAGAVPKQSMRPGTGNLLSGMGPNGAYIPFGAGPRNCIGTGTATPAHKTARQHPSMCMHGVPNVAPDGKHAQRHDGSWLGRCFGLRWLLSVMSGARAIETSLGVFRLCHDGGNVGDSSSTAKVQVSAKPYRCEYASSSTSHHSQAKHSQRAAFTQAAHRMNALLTILMPASAVASLPGLLQHHQTMMTECCCSKFHLILGLFHVLISIAFY